MLVKKKKKDISEWAQAQKLNHNYAQQPHTQDQVSRRCLFKVEYMKGQHIKKYQQKELDWWNKKLYYWYFFAR